MQPKPYSILGIPVDNLEIDGVIARIMDLIEEYRKLHPSNIASKTNAATALVSTMNVDFLANIHGWSLNSIRYPELMQVLRNSILVTADGMPIVWLSSLLGNPLKSRVTGADLVPQLCEVLGKTGLSVYFLGGEEEQIKAGVEHLQRTYPGLKIAGYSWPIVRISGPQLVEAPQRDRLLLEQINEVAPDVLFLCLGHPKQEIWFERVRRELHVPVAIGVGGALNFLSGHISRAPKWMQKLGMEWIYRLLTEPLRLFKRYSYDAVHFLFLSIPLIFMHRLNGFIARVRKPADTSQQALLFQSKAKSIAVIKMPSVIDEKSVDQLKNVIEEALAQDAVLLDFDETRHFDLAGLALLQNIWKQSHKERKLILGINLRKNVCQLLRFHKAWDLFAPYFCDSLEHLFLRLKEKGLSETLFEGISQSEGTTVFSFLGRIDASQDFDPYYEKLTGMSYKKHCVLDFSYCTQIDQTGFSFLLKLKQFTEANHQNITVKGLSRNLQRQFKIADLYKYFSHEGEE